MKTQKSNQILPSISLLMNPHHFYYRSVYIIDMGDHFRLVTNLGNGKINKVELYRTLRGARISFARVHKKRTELPDLTCIWTDFFLPEYGDFTNNIRAAMEYEDTVTHIIEDDE